jgi:hypothetical protein
MAKKGVLILVGIVVLLCGPWAAWSPASASPRSTAGTLDSGFHELGTQTPALVSRTGRSPAPRPAGRAWAASDITVSARSDSPVFLGIGRAAQVDAYPSSVPYDG